MEERMSVVLREDQKLRRSIKVYGIEGGVIVTLRHQGIEFTIPRTKVGVGMSWKKAVESCFVPSKAASIFEGRPTEFLQRQAQEATKRRIKKAEKENK
jgi:hypothetical protein